MMKFLFLLVFSCFALCQFAKAVEEAKDLESLGKEAAAELAQMQETSLLSSVNPLHDLLPQETDSTSFSISIISSGSSTTNPTDPNITITIISSASMPKPSFRPTRNPTAAPPTYKPTRQVLPIIQFTSTMSLSNVYNPQLDPPAQESLAEAMCGSLKLSLQDCVFVDFTLLTTASPTAAPTSSSLHALGRQLLLTDLDREGFRHEENEQLQELLSLQSNEEKQSQQQTLSVHTEATSNQPTLQPSARPIYSMTVHITCATVVPSSFASSPLAYFTQLSNSLALAVSSGSFNNQLRAYSTVNGASSTYRSTCWAVSSVSDGVSQPSSLHATQSDSAMSPGAVAGIVLGVLLAVALTMVAAAYYYKAHFSKQSYRYYEFDNSDETALQDTAKLKLQQTQSAFDEDDHGGTNGLYDVHQHRPKQQEMTQLVYFHTMYHTQPNLGNNNAARHNRAEEDELEILDDEAMVSISLHNKITHV